VTVAPRTVPAPAPAASSPSASRGPTRAATVITKVTPGFPARAKRQGIDAGVVTVEYTIDSSGSVKDAVVVKADPPHLFDDAVLDAIRQWKYQPKLVNGAPVDSRQEFTFRFE
jgi:protein TonB